jgi:hypothetical protein
MPKRKPLIQINLFKKRNKKSVVQQSIPSTVPSITKDLFKEWTKLCFRKLTSKQDFNVLAVFDTESIKLKNGLPMNADISINNQTSTIYFFLENMYQSYCSILISKPYGFLLTEEAVKDLQNYLEKVISGQLFALAMPDKPYVN